MRFMTIIIATALVAACESEPEQETRNMSPEEVAQELSSVKIEPGEWESTNEILSASAPGMPEEALKQMVGQKKTARNCITPEQAAQPSANFLAAQENSNCTYQDFAMKNGRMTGTMTCSGGQIPGEMVMAMEGEYGPTSYDMEMNMKTVGLPEGMTMTVKARTTGRRIGDCA